MYKRCNFFNFTKYLRVLSNCEQITLVANVQLTHMIATSNACFQERGTGLARGEKPELAAAMEAHHSRFT